MRKIKNFMVDYGDTSKVKKETFTVLDTLPCAITWFYNGTNHRIEYQDKLIPLMLKTNQYIAIVQAPYSKVYNKAYIINGNGEVIWDLKDILKGKRNIDKPLFLCTICMFVRCRLHLIILAPYFFVLYSSSL